MKDFHLASKGIAQLSSLRTVRQGAPEDVGPSPTNAAVGNGGQAVEKALPQEPAWELPIGEMSSRLE